MGFLFVLFTIALGLSLVAVIVFGLVWLWRARNDWKTKDFTD
jgi:hypothetical protein